MKAIRAAHLEGRDWKHALCVFLGQYRSTPHVTTTFSPHRLLFGREPKTKIPSVSCHDGTSLDPVVRRNDTLAKQAMKTYRDSRVHAKTSDIAVGDVVLMKQLRQNKLTSAYNPQPLIVTDRKGSMITASNSRGPVTRNVSAYKRVNVSPEGVEKELEEYPSEVVVEEKEDPEPPIVNTKPVSQPESPLQCRRSSRVSRPLKRLLEEI